MRIRKSSALIITVLIAVLACCLILAACNKEEEQVSYTSTDLFWRAPSRSAVVYSISTDNMTTQETEMIASLQGIVAKQSASIYIDSDDESAQWLEYASEKYGFMVERISDPWQLVYMFAAYLNGGKYVLYNSHGDTDTTLFDQTINYATTVAAADDYLMVAASIEDKAIDTGLTLGKDVRLYNTETVFDEYKDKLTRRLLVHQNPSKWELRDYAIAAGAMCFYSDYYDGSNIKDEILAWAEPNTPILGWTENEVNFVESNSIHSKITVAADWSSNLSLYSSFEQDESVSPANYDGTVPQIENKHYVAIVMSDGDNLQWMDNGFATDKKYFGSAYRGEFPMTWTIAPSMFNLAPHILDYLYENGTADDQFIAGPSGVGYVNATHYNSESLPGYAQLTASYMKATGIDCVNLLDSTVNADILGEFAKYDSVKGGVWSVGDKYIEGYGGVYWANDKPFVCMRETLWRIAGDDDSNAYYGFVERVAQRINSYKVDPTSIEGYTVVVAHAWSIGTMDYIMRFVDALDDDVEVVTVGQLLDLVSANVKHENVPYPDDISPEDITDLAPISSEQYRAEDIDVLETDPERVFAFDGANVSSYKWQFGDGGLQYDSAGYSSEGIKLDGSDLNDAIDPMPNAWTINKFALAEQDKYMRLFASISSGADVNMRVRVLWTENGKLHSEVLQSLSYEKELSEFGWYLFDSDSPLVYVYDLSDYAGRTVAISIEQDDTGDGDGEILFVSRLEIAETLTDGSDMSSWNISDIAAYWTKTGDVARHTEGICLEGENASVSNTVKVSGDTLAISMRKFRRPNYEGQDITAYVVVRIDGNIVRLTDAVTDYVEVGNTDENFYYNYDVSDYVGQTVKLEIVSIAVNGVVGEHACVSEILFR